MKMTTNTEVEIKENIGENIIDLINLALKAKINTIVIDPTVQIEVFVTLGGKKVIITYNNDFEIMYWLAVMDEINGEIVFKKAETNNSK